MPKSSTGLPSGNSSRPGETSGNEQISAELIRKVTEQVWLLWHAELKIENERHKKGNRQAGWNRYGGN